MSDKPEKLITDDGLRLDGRHADEIRPMKIEIGVLSRADGSCYLEWGRNKILVGVFGPREVHPRRSQRADTAVIRYKYNMASFSTEDRARPGPSRRSIEISKVSREAFEPVIMAELFPKTAIDIFVEILQADAGTRTAAINASSIALADAGIPMKGLVTSCAFGKVDGQIVLDLNKDEDNYGEADFPVAMTQDGEITLLQMDGNLTPDEIRKGFELVKKGCKEILEIQQAVLRKKFETPVEETESEAAEEAEETELEVVETEPSLEYAPEAAVVEEVIEETEESEEGISEETAEACAVNKEAPECEELETVIKDAEAEVVEGEAVEKVVEAEIEEEAEEEAFEDKADFESSFEASFENVSEPEKLEELQLEETVSGKETEIEPEIEEFAEEKAQPEAEPQLEEKVEVEEEPQLEQETQLEEEPQLEEKAEVEEEPQLEQEVQPEEAGIEEAASEEAFESGPEIESEAESRKEAPAEQAVEEPEEECKGPWKVVKDPSESGSRGENDE
ncbi:exosome complex exonuclease Rrp41 [Methanosarcina sp. A14]|uniref:Exosome complex component Rrp41 n=1 Tax=Methanosarcina barkeri MS TaxID=1434108 RepID=A0A0E3QW59_METBA|nr:MULTISPECIES: exosome complex exonuclease Rrp41 [Methanosarcina]AKB55032.1 Exosome complex exonuclease 1 [Methanosarcina barkeri MS]OED04725.1 exosome complex exonuclease Rrp41 [Methanosarcina sp. A14]